MDPIQQSPDMQIPQPAPQSRLALYLWLVAIAAVVAVGVLVFQLRTTGANADYICTKTVSVDGSCANGSWSAWTDVSNTTAGNVTTIVQQRTYTGTRATSKTLQYLNLRTACESGYSQQGYGGGGGNSGFHGGNVTTTESACQIAQTQTVTKSTGPTGSTYKWSVTNSQTDTGNQTTSKVDVASLGELNAQDTGNGGNGGNSWATADASGELSAKPSLVGSGSKSTVAWTASGVPSCVVTSTGGDSWTGLTGTQLSKPIMQQTTFTLTCPLGGGTNMTATAVVNVVPQFQEQ